MKQLRYKKFKIALNLGIICVLTACGGSNQDESNPTPEPTQLYDITVIDGYIRGAIAYIDINGNKKRDENEPWVKTSAGGEGQIDITSLGLPPEDISIIVDVPAGAVDESTITDEFPEGVPVTAETAFQMVSLPGENVATPLTTLVAMIAGDGGDIDTAKEKVADDLAITVADINSDYLAAGNEELTVLTELIIENTVIPKNVTTDVTPAQLLVASTVSAKLSTVVQEANAADKLTSDKIIIQAAAAATTKAVSTFVENNQAELNETTAASFAAVIEVVADTASGSFTELATSEDLVTAEEIEQASQYAEVMTNVVVDLLVDDIASEEGVTAEATTSAEEVVDIVSGAVKQLIVNNDLGKDGSIDSMTMTGIAVIVAEQTAEKLTELAASDLTDEEKATELEDIALGAENLANSLEEQVKNDAAIDDLDGDSIANNVDPDIDGDGALNATDAFPFDATETLDTDGDGTGNNADADIDGDGALNAADAFPLDASESLDTDGDGTGNNADADIDGDGALNAADAFPLDASESLDTDGDKLGNNVDPDIDGDGVLNAADAFPLDAIQSVDSDNDGVADPEDLAPLDDSVGKALPLDASILADSYLFIERGQLPDPNLAMGSLSGDRLDFVDDGTGTQITYDGEKSFRWTISHNSLLVTYDDPDANAYFSYFDLTGLIELGVITQAQADSYLAQPNSEGYVFVKVSHKADRFQLIDSTAETDGFFVKSISSYDLVVEGQREALLGSVDAHPINVEDAGVQIELLRLEALAVLPFEPQEVTGQWALPIGLSLGDADSEFEFAADIANFNADMTGTTKIFAHSFTWSIDSDGTLVVIFPALDVEIRYSKYEAYGTGLGVHTQITTPDQSYSSYSLAVKMAATPAIDGLMNRYMMNSFILTKTNSYDENQQIKSEAFSGFRLETGGLATRIVDGDFDMSSDADWQDSGWQRWYWTQEQDGSIAIESRYIESYWDYDDCSPLLDSMCRPARRLHWEPLALVGKRLYVLEWEERASQGTPEIAWHKAYGSNVNFYQVYDNIDSDRDGIMDAEDEDLDNDGYNNGSDAFPFDATESADMDGDGAGDNSDALPNNPTEAVDSDGDGLGNNADPDDDNDGLLDELDQNPLVYDLLLGGLQFTDPAIQACIYSQYDATTPVNDINRLWCSSLSGVSSLADLTKLTHLLNLSIQGAEVSDWSALAELTSLTELSLNNSSFGDVALLSELTQLTELNLYGSKITHAGALTDLTQLQNLSLGGTEVQDWTFLSSLTNLESFSARDSSFTDLSLLAGANLSSLDIGSSTKQIVNWGVLASWPNLTRLSVSNTNFSDLSLLQSAEVNTLSVRNTAISDWSSIAAWEQLYQLDLYGTSFSDLSLIPNTQQFWILNLGKTQVTDWRELTGFNVNGYLTLSDTDFSDLSLISHMTELETLRVNNTSISNLDALAQLVSLTELRAGTTQVADLTALKELVNLTDLYLDYTQVTDLSPILELDLYRLSINGVVLDDSGQVDVFTARGVYVAGGVDVDVDVDVEAGGPVLADIQFADPAIQACVYSQYEATTPVNDINRLWCSYLSGVSSLADLTQLTHLLNLSIQGAEVSDWSALAELTSLTGLSLNNSSFGDVALLSELTQLTELNLYGSKITHAAVLAGLTQLQNLRLGGTEVQDWTFLSSLTNLESFSASNSSFTDLSLLAGANLSSLDIGSGDTGSTKQIVNWGVLASWPNLTRLSVSNTNFSDLSLLQSTEVNTLSVRNTAISDWSSIAAWQQLNQLDLYGTSFSDLSLIPNTQQFWNLGLGKTQVTDWRELTGFNVNGYLTLSDTDFSDLSLISHMTELETLRVNNTSISNINALAQLISLVELRAGTTQVADLTALKELVNLTDLYLDYTQVTDLSPILALDLNNVIIRGVVLDDPSQVDVLKARGVNVTL